MLQSRPITTIVHPDHVPTEVLVRGLGAAPGSASGSVRLLEDPHDTSAFHDGEVLVTHMTTPDWVPLMRKAAAIVTDSGGMTCHAAIVSRELGIPCIVGTGEATKRLRNGELVTVDATHGTVLEGAAPAPSPDGAAAAGASALLAAAGSLQATPVTATRLLVNLSEPSQVERTAQLEVDGVGLLRAELMLIEALDGTHPKQLIEEGRSDEFVARMADALGAFAAGFTPRPVTYRTTDFRTNEFRNLRGGERFEPQEANPMIGYRGALRYTQEPEVFALEMQAVRRVWDEGHENFHVMLPFVRTAAELERCRALVAESGLLERPGFELWVMAEVPSVLFNLERYAELGIAGISIGSNDLTQLILGADRDSEVLAATFDERDPAVDGISLGADSACARARAAHLDLRPGALRAPGVRRAARTAGDRQHLGERRRGRAHTTADRRGRATRDARGRARSCRPDAANPVAVKPQRRSAPDADGPRTGRPEDTAAGTGSSFRTEGRGCKFSRGRYRRPGGPCAREGAGARGSGRARSPLRSRRRSARQARRRGGSSASCCSSGWPTCARSCRCSPRNSRAHGARARSCARRTIACSRASKTCSVKAPAGASRTSRYGVCVKRFTQALGNLAAAVSVAALAGCGGSSGSPTTHNASPTTSTSTSPTTAPSTVTQGPGVVSATAGDVRATMRAGTHQPRVGAPWPVHFEVTAAGQPAKASVEYEFVFGAQVVAHRSHYTFTGHFSDIVLWPSSAVGYPLTFRAAITTGTTRVNLDYAVQVRQ